MNARRRLLQALLIGLLPASVAAADDRDARPGRVAFWRDEVALVVSGADDSSIAFVNVHENERTSVIAARELLAGRSERLIELRSRGRRTVMFWIGRRPYVFDPNRIFSDRGIERALRHYGADSAAARAEVARLRDAIVDALRPQNTALIVALHNNGVGTYSIDSYRLGGEYAAEAKALHVDARAAPSDFFLVATRRAFDSLVDSGFGVVLQHPQARDDGSMSVRFATDRPAYVNVEARHGHLAQQRRMLEVLLERAGRFAVPAAPARG